MSEGWYDRLLEERDDLQSRLDKLDAFLANTPSVGEAHRELLMLQSEWMAELLEVLGKRIDLGPE